MSMNVFEKITPRINSRSLKPTQPLIHNLPALNFKEVRTACNVSQGYSRKEGIILWMANKKSKYRQIEKIPPPQAGDIVFVEVGVDTPL